MIASRPTRTSAYFYSRPCGRGDQRQAVCQHTARISTHAPAGGATQQQRLHLSCARISTHAPAGGATHSNVRHMRMETHFYSRPCGRGDAAVISDLPSHVISTHAPAGGATNMSLNDGSPTIFLLTPLREGRPTIRAMQTHAATISTHAPAGGATRKIDSVNQGLCISTHAPAGGATPRCVRGGWDVFYFYSRPCGRGDRSCR